MNKMKHTYLILIVLILWCMMFASCSSSTCKVSYKGKEITITMPLRGSNMKDVYNMEEKIYNKLHKGKGTYNITLTVKILDKYGHYSQTKSYSLGSWDTEEVQKYASYYHFKGQIYDKMSKAVSGRSK